jgi:hypothetical protein
MIGSCTLVVKKLDGSYRVHIVGLVLDEVKAEEWVGLDDKYKDKPDVDNLTDADIYQILSSHQCASEDQPHYSKFAGDRKWFLDLYSKSYLSIEDFTKNWETVFAEQLAKETAEREIAITKKKKRVLNKLKKDADVYCVTLIKFLEGKLTLSPKPASYAKGDTDYDQIEFNVGKFSFSKSRRSCNLQCFTPGYDSDHDLVNFNFDDVFFKHLKNNGWKVTTITKSDTYSHSNNRSWTAAWFATKKNTTIFQSREHDLAFVTMKSI